MGEELDKRMLQNKMIEARHSIMTKYPFFGSLLMGIKLGYANIGTAATDMKRIIWDPQFLARLTIEEVEFVMVHEVLHCVLQHCIRGEGLDSELYNIACDIVVNSTILHYLKLKDFSVDGNVVIHKTPCDSEGYLFTVEQVYQMLNVDKVNKSGSNGNDTEDGQLGNDRDNSFSDACSNDTDDQDNNDNANGMDEQESSKTLDNHGTWSQVSSNDKYMQETWKSKLLEAAKKEKKYSMIGSDMRKLIENYENEGRVDWKSVLNQFIEIVYDNKDYTFSPYDRRFSNSPFILPAFNDMEEEKLQNLWFVVDTSGSITDEMLIMMIGEIRYAISQFERLAGKISFFDTKVSRPIDFEDDLKIPSADSEILGGGGTSFHAIFNYLEEKMKEDLPKAIIILTDGEAPYPLEKMALNIPVLWILVDALKEAPWGISVMIKSN